MLVKLETSRDGGLMARIDGTISFPERQDPRLREAHTGESWEVTVTGSNPKGTVKFFRLDAGPAEIKAREEAQLAARRAEISEKKAYQAQEVKTFWDTVRPVFMDKVAEFGDFAKPAQEFAKSLDSGSIFQRYTPESLKSALDCKIKNCIGRQELRQAWDNRILSPIPETIPPEIPNKPQFMTRPIPCRWTSYWEGDGMRPGDNTRESQDEKTVETLTGNWVDIASQWLTVYTNIAGIDCNIDKDIAELQSRECTESVFYGRPEYVLTANSLIMTDIYKTCHDVLINMWREYTLHKYNFLCSHTEADGGLVRLIDSLPCIPVSNYDGFQEIAAVKITDGLCSCPEYMELSTWEDLESFMDYGD